MAIMSKMNADRLALNSHLLKLSDNSYLKDENNPNYEYVKKRYFDNSNQKTNILNIGS